MFEGVTRRPGRRRAVRGSAFLLGSALVQVGILALLVALSARTLRKASSSPMVPVTFARQPAQAAPAPPPPPPPPSGARPTASRPVVRTVRPTPPVVITQPREVPDKPPPVQTEPAPQPDPSPEGGVDAGVVDGVAGGQAGGTPGGTVGGTIGGVVGASGSGGADPDQPQELTNGFRAPSEGQPGCMVQSVRIPPQLAGFVSGPIKVRFAVGRSGEVSRAAVLSAVPDSRIERAILAAIQGCKWNPGADAEGRPISLWVRTSVRFTSSR